MQAQQQRFFISNVSNFISCFVAGVVFGQGLWGMEERPGENSPFVSNAYRCAIVDALLLAINNDPRYTPFLLGFMGFFLGVAVGYSTMPARQQAVSSLSLPSQGV